MIENWRIVCHCRMKRHNILLLPLVAVLLSTCVTVVRPEHSIKRLMDKYTNIISVEERWGFNYYDYQPHEIRFYSEAALDIKMEDGKRLFIAFIRSSDLKSPFQLCLIGRSTFETFPGTIRDRRAVIGNYTYLYGLPIHFVEKNIGIQLKSVDDVIENYDLILDFTDSLTKIVDIDDIDIRNQMIREMHHSNHYYLSVQRYMKYIQPIIVDGEKWYILNATQDVTPNNRRLYSIENMNERERSYIHYRN